MKKYISGSTKILGIITLITAVMFITGIVLTVIDFENFSLQLFFTLIGGMLSLIFLPCYLAERSRTLVIDADKITFPKGAQRNGKTSLKKTVVKFEEISSIKSDFYKGDKVISKDCFFHKLKLKNGTEITITLYHYGKEAENEILEIIQKNIV